MKKGMKVFLGIVSIAPVLFLLGLVASFVFYYFFPIPIAVVPRAVSWLIAAGVILIVLGTALAFAAQRVSRVVTNPKYKATCPDLMQGPYAYSRHPGSLSLVIMYVGFALIVNSLVMLGLSVIFIFLLSLIFVPAEERVIASLCPEAYAEYKQKVRMWI